MRNLKIMALALGAFALAMPSMPADAQNRSGDKGSHGGGGHAKAGKPTGHAKTSANRAPAGNYAGNRGGGVSNKNAYKAGQASSNRNPGNNPNRNNVNRKGGNNVVAGNTVVVNGNGGRGYYDNGRYYDGHYDDDDNDFLEFVGKTAAITAGASVVAAVIGSSTNQKPDGCQPVNANGTSYMYCNGTYYQQSGPTSQPTYTVVAPPQ
ncbi:DUF6515 family protein [Sandaracinobacteroides hominis]|uniref:DUF6515 family protein n=1 Tax=Sandaracinobacteroides hominis TaxID=2780086 RepID=UPI0018F42930|nr:DUF6515 family protein [Sandaracinobacteroides hominis]